jgi:hypothetical protein
MGKGFDIGKALEMLFPVLVAAVGWLLAEVTSFNSRITSIESKLPALITPEGVPTDSPISAERRHHMKEEIYKDIHDLQVRVKLIEERGK